MSSAHVYLRPPASSSLAAAVGSTSAAASKPGNKAGGSDASAPSPSGRGGGKGAEGEEAAPLAPRAWHDIPKQVLADCCQLVKHNSIAGSKAAAVDVVFTPAPNLLKTDRMDTGQVSNYYYRVRMIIPSLSRGWKEVEVGVTGENQREMKRPLEVILKSVYWKNTKLLTFLRSASATTPPLPSD